ncbi:hypothetical protein, partial [Pseudomonas sp. SLFW]|uniref:hypothetical protein n=1 Tax=Pseudomonas sp. SLFW TaxID=2683259 RepID=UPI001C49C6F3
ASQWIAGKPAPTAFGQNQKPGPHHDPLLPKAWERCLLAIHCAAMATTAYAVGQADRSRLVLLPLRDRSQARWSATPALLRPSASIKSECQHQREVTLRSASAEGVGALLARDPLRSNGKSDACGLSGLTACPERSAP